MYTIPRSSSRASFISGANIPISEFSHRNSAIDVAHTSNPALLSTNITATSQYGLLNDAEGHVFPEVSIANATSQSAVTPPPNT